MQIFVFPGLQVLWQLLIGNIFLGAVFTGVLCHRVLRLRMSAMVSLSSSDDRMSPSNLSSAKDKEENFFRNIVNGPVEMQDAKNCRSDGEEINGKIVGILPREWKGKYTLSIFDYVISLAVVGPLVVGQWCGIWSLMDFYKLPLSDWVAFLLGISLHCAFACFRCVLHRTIAEHWRLANPIGRGGYRVARLVYTYLFGMSCVLHWRGGWSIFSYVVGYNLWVNGVITLIFYVLLLVLKSSRNLLAPPFIIAVDIPPLVFNFPTRYRADKAISVT